MAPRPTTSNNDWLEEMLRRMFLQAEYTSENPAKTMPEEEAKAARAARDARQLAKVALQMAITVLEAAEEKQDEADKLLRKCLATEKEQRKAEKAMERQRLAQEEVRRKQEQARQVEVEKMRQAMERLQREEKEQARIKEEKKREAQRRRDDEERRAAEQVAANALKRAQAEAKKYREAAERAEHEAFGARNRAEQAEEAQRQQAAKAESIQALKDQQNESAAWARYTEKWELFRRFALIATPNPGGVFRFEDIPWPVISTPSAPSAITKDQVATFLYSSSSGQAKTLKTRIRDCLLTWHPGKFSGRWMRFVLENDRTRVMEAVTGVTRAGNEIMAEYASRRSTL